MRQIRAGTSGLSDPGHDFAALDLVEVHLGRGPMPSLQDALQWRRAAPAEFAFILRVEGSPRETAGLRGVRRHWKEALELVHALDAALVIVPTPANFRPSDDTIDTLERFFPWAHRDGVRIGWEPRGNRWPDKLLTDLCREHTVSHVVDPMERSPVRGRPPCFRLNGIGGPQHRYSDAELAEIRRRCDAYGEGHAMYDAEVAYCIFGNASRGEDARRLRGA